jgi:FkbM family methyltransferase
MPRKVHVFDNGVSVYDDHLIPAQRQRYRKRNVHEAEEEDIFAELIRQLPADGCYLNIGSAIGYYPLLARRLAPALTIHAVEPLVQHRVFFAENIRLNGLDPTTFTIHEQAIGATDGKALFLEQGYGSVLLRGAPPHPVSVMGLFRKLLAALGIRARKADPSGGRMVEITTLDTLVGAIGRIVNLVQMDVQGLEADILRGGARTLRMGRVETFLIGTHGRDVHRACAEELERYGYRIKCSEAEAKDQPDGILVAQQTAGQAGKQSLGLPPRDAAS